MRILFDGWFSQAYNFIEQIKEGYNKDVGDNDLFIIGTHDKYMGWMELCNEFKIRKFFDQRLYNSKSYLTEVFEFYSYIVKEYNIDVIFSKTLNTFSCDDYKETCIDIEHNANIINDFFELLQSLNCKIVRDSASPLLSNKVCTYKKLHEIPKFKNVLPNYAECSTMEDVRKFYNPVNHNLVLKTEIGDGARNIQVKDFPFNFEFDKNHSSFVMNYLSNEEISLDCLQIEDEFLCIPRKKNKTNRSQYILYKDNYYEELKDYCKEIQIKFNLQMPFNVQFKMDEFYACYLLEINPRLSAGSSMCYLLGVNLPWLTLKKLFNIPIFATELDWTENTYVSYYEKPILIEKGD